MTSSFVGRANERLIDDLGAYIDAVHDFVSGYPRVIELCEGVVKEAMLARALLAFASGPEVQDIGLRVYRFFNRWPMREQPFRRTQGFANELAEANELSEEAKKLLERVTKGSKHDPLMGEMISCFENIISYLEEERQLLSESHERIQPYIQEMEMIRKRLDLLIAAVDARVPKGEGKERVLANYREAAAILHDWEHGVPLDEEGLEILQRCLRALTGFKADSSPAVTPIQLPGDSSLSQIADVPRE